MRSILLVTVVALATGCVQVTSRGPGAGAERNFCGESTDAPCLAAPEVGNVPNTRTCWFRTGGDPGERPLAEAFYRFESTALGDSVRVALVFAEAFVDNTYGERSSSGYRRGRDVHELRDLVGSDHAAIALSDATGARRLSFALDYLSRADATPSGYRAFGIWGGDGRMIAGDPQLVLTATSSMDDNMNVLGCVFEESSPTVEQCPLWERRVIYTVWVDVTAFGAAGFGAPELRSVHASPSRMQNTVDVTPGPCPPD